MALLRTIRDIESAYEAANEASDGFRYRHAGEIRTFDRLIATLPDRCLVE